MGKQKKRTIAFISELIPPATGGAGIRALRTAQNLPKVYDVTLFTRIPNDCDHVSIVSILPGLYSTFTKKARVFSKLADVFILPFALLFKLLTLKGLKNISLFHSFSVSWLTVYLFLINKLFLKRPFIIELTLMGADTPGNNKKWWLFKKFSDYCIKNATQVNCISPLLYEYMRGFGFSESRLSLISNSYDARFKPASVEERIALREKYGISKNTFVLCTVGHISARKGYLLITEILKSLPKNFNFNFISVGNYKFEKLNNLKNRITKDLKLNQLENKTLFVGFQDPLPYLQMSDAFLFASLREGFGSAVIEAMACGLPVICKNIEGITEYIVDNEVNGYVLKTDNPIDYSKKIISLSENPSKRKDIGMQALHSVKDRFSLSSIISQYIELYNKLLRQ